MGARARRNNATNGVGADGGPVASGPGECTNAVAPSVSRERYAAFARQTPEQIARDCDVRAFHATGPGGQGVNTADSAVRMLHRPTGIAVTARESRSQHQNRAICLHKLHEEFERRAREPKSRKPTKPSRAAKARRLADKRAQARKKQLRRRPSAED